MTFSKIGVIGAGLMGSGIAAQITNAGVPVVLLDIVPDKAEDRNVLARSAVQKMLKSDPAPFMDPENASLITPGNTEDDLELLKDCDWIIEAVLEDTEVKHKTYQKIEKVIKKGTIVSSNTSTIPLHNLIEKSGKDFQENFLITHFFNPPRYLRLLEIVKGDKTEKKSVQRVEEFCDRKLGKTVVYCHDTPGFIANRLAIFWMQTALNKLFEQDVSIEVADAVLSKPVGIPKTGVFGLIDLIGVDLVPHLAESMLSTLPEEDTYRKIYRDYAFIHQMIDAGYTGRKGKGGFYRLNPEGQKTGKKDKQALRIVKDGFDEKQYEAAIKPKLQSVDNGKRGIKAVVQTDDEGGRYAWAVLQDVLCYMAGLVPQIADDIFSVDEAVKRGLNFKNGPFEMIDALGPAWFAKQLEKNGKEVPHVLEKLGDDIFYKVLNGKLHFFGLDGKYHPVERADGVLLLSDIKLGTEPVLKSESAAVWDIGEGVLCLEFTGKMNALDEQVFDVITKTVKTIGDGKGAYSGLVVYNEGTHFSAGANLGMAMFAMNIALWQQIESLIRAGQNAYDALKFAPFPVVSAPSGMALGGGCEILLHSDHIQAHAETYCGLVEAGVGLIPGWGGCKEMILRYRDLERQQHDRKTQGNPVWFSPSNSPMGTVRQAFETIGMAKVSRSANDARKIGYMRDSDGITMNRDRLLYDAKQKVLELSKNYKPPQVVEDIRLPGPTGEYALHLAVHDMHKSGKATDYDAVVAGHLAKVLSGAENADITEPVSEKYILEREVEEFMKLVRNEGTMARIEYMLENGKPLRN